MQQQAQQVRRGPREGCSASRVLLLIGVAAASSVLTSIYHREACTHGITRGHQAHDPRDPHGQQNPSGASLSVTAGPQSIGIPIQARSAPPLPPPPPPPPPPPGQVLRNSMPSMLFKRVQKDLSELPVIILGLDTPEAEANVNRLGYILNSHGLNNVQWMKATDARGGLFQKPHQHFKTSGRPLAPGELGTRDSFRRILLHAWHMGYQRILVLEDDVTPHCSLGNSLAKLLYNSQCGSWAVPNFQKGGQPGLFMLGATCYFIGKTPNGLVRAKGCYDATFATYGAFALLFRRDAIPAILRWLYHSSLPVDNFFGYLAEKPEFQVQVAFPNLFAPQLAHNSSTQPWKDYSLAEVEKRMTQHRWVRRNYCGWDYEFGASAPWEGLGRPLVPTVVDFREHATWSLVASLRQYDPQDPVASLPTVILTLEPEGDRVASLRRLLKAHGLTNVAVWEGLDGRKLWGGAGDTSWDPKLDMKPGEMGVSQSNRELLKAQWFAGLERMLILEDDALPHCKLKERLESALRTPACGGITLEPDPGKEIAGGVLMLGATEYSKWPGLLEEMAGGGSDEPKDCYECNQGTYGAFAVIYSRDAIPLILRWMEEVNRHYDNMWHFLRVRGMKVRVMFPNLFMPDIMHESATNPNKASDRNTAADRIRLHKWAPGLYCNEDRLPAYA